MERPSADTASLPFETEELRNKLEEFLNFAWKDPITHKSKKIGSYKWGIYAFFDYDEEPIYVGQTNEKLSTRIRRHLTNQRSDAVAMSVLDPYEVCYIQVWPVPELEGKPASPENKALLSALEYAAYQHVLTASTFGAVLNEKEPAEPAVKHPLPELTYRMRVVSDAVSKLRDHPDLRIARRAMTLARLAKVIAERKVQKGLRTTLLTQARRLTSLAEQRVAYAPDGEATDDEGADD